MNEKCFGCSEPGKKGGYKLIDGKPYCEECFDERQDQIAKTRKNWEDARDKWVGIVKDLESPQEEEEWLDYIDEVILTQCGFCKEHDMNAIACPLAPEHCCECSAYYNSKGTYQSVIYELCLELQALPPNLPGALELAKNMLARIEELKPEVGERDY